MAKRIELPSALTSRFEVKNRRGHWEFWCNHCSRGWRVQYPSRPLRPGDTVMLFNHARSHEENAVVS